MFWLLLEAIGILLAASTVRMVAGTLAGLAALSIMIANRFVSDGSSFLFPLALLVFVLLAARGANHLRRDTLLVCAFLSLCCVWNARAWILLPAAACAFIFQVLLPDSGSTPWHELLERSKRLPSHFCAAFIIVVAVPVMIALSRGTSNTSFEVRKPYLFSGLMLIAFVWLLFGLREVDGKVVILAGLPLSCGAVDPVAARPLLLCVATIVAALSLRSYRVKREVR